MEATRNKLVTYELTFLLLLQKWGKSYLELGKNWATAVSLKINFEKKNMGGVTKYMLLLINGPTVVPY